MQEPGQTIRGRSSIYPPADAIRNGGAFGIDSPVAGTFLDPAQVEVLRQSGEKLLPGAGEVAEIGWARVCCSCN